MIRKFRIFLSLLYPALLVLFVRPIVKFVSDAVSATHRQAGALFLTAFALVRVMVLSIGNHSFSRQFWYRLERSRNKVKIWQDNGLVSAV